MLLTKFITDMQTLGVRGVRVEVDRRSLAAILESDRTTTQWQAALLFSADHHWQFEDAVASNFLSRYRPSADAYQYGGLIGYLDAITVYCDVRLLYAPGRLPHDTALLYRWCTHPIFVNERG